MTQRQTRIQKQASRSTQERAREAAYETLDCQTDRVIRDAYKASQRAQRLLSELREI